MEFRVKVVPKSSRTELVGYLPDGTWKVKVAAAPEKGKANQALVEFLADTLGIKKNAIKITSGQTSPVKTLEIAGLSAESLSYKLNLHSK
jgi:uncharacterized protein